MCHNRREIITLSTEGFPSPADLLAEIELIVKRVQFSETQDHEKRRPSDTSAVESTLLLLLSSQIGIFPEVC